MFSDGNDNVSNHNSLRHTSSLQLTALSTGLPSMALSVVVIWYFGSKKVQTAGFLAIAILFVFLGCLFEPLHKNHPRALFALYCFLLSVLIGPVNMTTFVLPSEMYEKRHRSTLNGISAACGKLGEP